MKKKPNHATALGDFTTTVRVIPISLLAILIGFVASFVAWLLLKLIGLATNLFYFGRLDTSLASPADNHLGLFAVAIPVLGSLIVGLMARYGSERIRGHGIPEAIESILMNGSRVQPKLALLKPVSAAIAIGSGGPFGAEGPIIMTGGAFGSLIAQFFHLTSAERKTLLVAGAAAGMSATFSAPLSAALLAIELLLFEWKPRSAIPVALASATAGVMRHYILGPGPIFPILPHIAFIGSAGLLSCAVVGVLAGLLSAALTFGVYLAEDSFGKLPIHWMWWPAIGGLFVGLGGLIFPHALGVGYENISALLTGKAGLAFILGVLLVKSSIWVISLGSGTSGGVLAPLLMMGAALGGVEAMFLPDFGVGFWPAISLGAILGGTMRAPLTGIVFTIELTNDFSLAVPLLVASFVAYGFTVLCLKRSILTEKIARRGYHLSREYAIDPLEILFVREVMRSNVVAIPADVTLDEAREWVRSTDKKHGQNLFPLVDEEENLVAVVSRNHLSNVMEEAKGADCQQPLRKLLVDKPVIAYPDEPLRLVVYRMVETGFTRLPVVEPSHGNSGTHGRLLGLVALSDLLHARSRNLEEERARERVLRLRMPLSRRSEKTVVTEGQETPV
ncbi:MAG: chloride channel protein [Acidobacteriaceae bacterium]|nr:chloride channel protein [Acidobacteriaceae bacterium]